MILIEGKTEFYEKAIETAENEKEVLANFKKVRKVAEILKEKQIAGFE